MMVMLIWIVTMISYWFPIDDLPKDSYDDYDADLYADDNDDDDNKAGYDRWWCWLRLP